MNRDVFDDLKAEANETLNKCREELQSKLEARDRILQLYAKEIEEAALRMQHARGVMDGLLTLESRTNTPEPGEVVNESQTVHQDDSNIGV